MPSPCTAHTNTHVHLPHVLGWQLRAALAMQAPQLPPALQRAFGHNWGSSQPSSPWKQQQESPLFPYGKSQLVKAALPAAKGNFQKMQDTRYRNSVVLQGCSATDPGTRQPLQPPAPAETPALLGVGCCWFVFLGGGLKFAAAARQEPPACCEQANPGPGFPSEQGPAADAHHHGDTHGASRFLPGGRRGPAPTSFLTVRSSRCRVSASVGRSGRSPLVRPGPTPPPAPPARRPPYPPGPPPWPRSSAPQRR